MDERADDPADPRDGEPPDLVPGEPDRVWAAPLRAVVLGVVATVGLAAWSVATVDPPGRLLVGLAAVAIAVATAVGGLARPRLAASDDGLHLGGALRTRSWPWARVDAVRAVRMRRLGMPSTYVEVDARDDDGTERLLVLGRLELGADPLDVVGALQHHRARAGRLRAGGGTGEGAVDAGAGGPPGPLGQSQVADRDEDEQRHDDDPGEGEPRRDA